MIERLKVRVMKTSAIGAEMLEHADYAVSKYRNSGEMLARCWSNITHSVKENTLNLPRSRPHRKRHYI